MAGKVIVGPEDAVGASSTAPVKEAPKPPSEPAKIYVFVCAVDSQPAIVPGLNGPTLLWPGIEYPTSDPVLADKFRADKLLKEVTK